MATTKKTAAKKTAPTSKKPAPVPKKAPVNGATIKNVVAKDSKHLASLIKSAVKTYGKNCDLNFIDVSKVTDMSFLFRKSQFND